MASSLDSSYPLRRKDRGDGAVRVCEDACVDMSRTTYVLGGKDVASMSELARGLSAWLAPVELGWPWSTTGRGNRPGVLVEDT